MIFNLIQRLKVQQNKLTATQKIMLRLAGILLFIAAATVSCSVLNRNLGLDDDNIGEEIIEELIQYKTGIDLDLTPDS